MQKLIKQKFYNSSSTIISFSQDHIRKIKWNIDNPKAYVNRLNGAPVKAIVEYVRDGSTVRLCLLPDFTSITLMLSGIRVSNLLTTCYNKFHFISVLLNYTGCGGKGVLSQKSEWFWTSRWSTLVLGFFFIAISIFLKLNLIKLIPKKKYILYSQVDASGSKNHSSFG